MRRRVQWGLGVDRCSGGGALRPPLERERPRAGRSAHGRPAAGCGRQSPGSRRGAAADGYWGQQTLCTYTALTKVTSHGARGELEAIEVSTRPDIEKASWEVNHSFSYHPNGQLWQDRDGLTFNMDYHRYLEYDEQGHLRSEDSEGVQLQQDIDVDL